MKCLIILPVFLLPIVNVAGQDSSYKYMVIDAINSIRSTDTIFYTDSSTKIYRFSAKVKNDKVAGHAKSPRSATMDTMTFLKQELKQIEKAISKQSRVEWPVNYFGNSKRISSHSIDSFKRYLYTSEFQIKPKYRYYYHISQPVYLRNNTVAIFRLSEMIDPSTGYDFILIYRRNTEGWQRKMIINTGAW